MRGRAAANAAAAAAAAGRPVLGGTGGAFLILHARSFLLPLFQPFISAQPLPAACGIVPGNREASSD